MVAPYPYFTPASKEIISNTNYLYIADTGNNRIRAISAVCTFICENGGVCTGSDTCVCTYGWKGVDCTVPVCTVRDIVSVCGVNMLCVGPDQCACKPGFKGINCDIPLCIQVIINFTS